jgi:lysophospholipase
MTSVNNISTASPFSMQWHSDIEQVWGKGTFSDFQAYDGIKIQYAAFNLDITKPCIVISPGRGEGYLKYKELAFDLIGQGYQLFIIDHRGQGLSDRLLDNRYKGYVKQFDEYADDLHQFIKQIVMPHCGQHKPLLLAHSMGGAIAIRLLQKHPNSVAVSVLCSPMIAINTGLIPRSLAKCVISGIQIINQLFSLKPWYFLGQKDHQPSEFHNNKLSHCYQRHQTFLSLYRQCPQLQLGGVTNHWLLQAFKTEHVIFEEVEKITCPVFILQAGNDEIVCNHAQAKFCQHLHEFNSVIHKQAQPTVIAGAKHELFFESDIYRRPALNSILNWFKEYQ